MNIKSHGEARDKSLSSQRVAVVDTSDEKFNDLLEGLRWLDNECGPSVNKNDRATVLIHACLDQGGNTRAQIMALLKPLGFDYRHIAIILKAGTGNDPAHHRWQQDDNGVYRNLA